MREMGLDMWIESFPKKFETEEDFQEYYSKNFNKSIEIAYFRKHSDLHGYFRDIFHERNKDFKDDFNCIPFILTKEDVKTVLELTKKQLKGEEVFKKARGFFWGESCREDWEYTKEVFSKILDTFDFDNNTLFYYSWW